MDTLLLFATAVVFGMVPSNGWRGFAVSMTGIIIGVTCRVLLEKK